MNPLFGFGTFLEYYFAVAAFCVSYQVRKVSGHVSMLLLFTILDWILELFRHTEILICFSLRYLQMLCQGTIKLSKFAVISEKKKNHVND
jgi:hypothetical protein